MAERKYPLKQEIHTREKRKRHRKNVIRAQKVVMGAIVVAVLGGAGMIAWNVLPGLKVDRQIKAGDELIETAAYQEAIATYQEALNIDATSVKAYRAMAGAYLTIKDSPAAEQVLYQGWETTQDEGLLDYYCTVLLNEAVEEINEQRCSFETMSKCVAVLEKNSSNEDVGSLLDICYNRLLQTQDEENVLTRFCTEKEDQVGGFEQYVDCMNRMIKLYDTTQDTEVRAQLGDRLIMFATIDIDEVVFETENLEAYQQMLGQIQEIKSTDAVTQIQTCLEKAAWALEVFAPAFTIWESGSFEPIKEFMGSDTYLSIRDSFMDGSMEYWSGQTYIPVSREKIKLLRDEEGNYSFAFLSMEECPDTAGVINIWSTQQADAGVQRLIISYEPALTGGEYYPHTTYEILYLYSNVMIDGEYVPQMNYRFETKVETEAGIETELIGDWGGEHQWETIY